MGLKIHALDNRKFLVPTLRIVSLFFLITTEAYADVPNNLKFNYQYKSCDVTTDQPIYINKASEKCTVISTKPYSDETCPAATYKQCRIPEHGIDFWLDATVTEITRYESGDGYGSLEGCKIDGRAYVQSANSGSRKYLPKLSGEYRYNLKFIQWEGTDNTFLGRRIKATHGCTYTIGRETPIYISSPDDKCGVEFRTSCKLFYEYSACRDPSHGIERYKIENKRDSACGIRSEIGFFDLSSDETVITEIGDRLDITTIDKRVSFVCDEETNPIKKFYCLKINEHSLGLAQPSPLVSELTQALRHEASNALADSIIGKDGKRSYDAILDLYLSDKSIKKEGVKSSELFFKTIRRSIKRMPDDLYFKTAFELSRQALLGSSSTSSAGNKNYDFNPLWSFLTTDTLRSRRPQFNDLGNLKQLLLSSAPNVSQKLRGQKLIIAEFLSRVTFSYINKRSYDVLQLEAVKAKLMIEQIELKEAIDTASLKVKSMKLAPNMEQAALTHLTDVDTTQNMIFILEDLIKTAKNDIAQTIKDADRFFTELSTDDKLFGVTMGQIQLINGNYNHAVLAIRTSSLSYQREPDANKLSSKSDTSFDLFTSNFKRQINASLASAEIIFKNLNAGTNIDIDMLTVPDDQLNISYAIMDVMGKLNLTTGSNLNESRMQILNELNSSIIQPLQTASEQLK